MKKMADFLLEELLLEIFQRLPIKPLVRFTAVCKSWYNLITCSDFISTHLIRTDAPKKTHNILFGISTENEQGIFRYDDRLYDDSLSRISIPFNFSKLVYRLVGSANGLLCFRDHERLLDPVAIFWNPSIQKSVYTHLPNLDAVTPSWRFFQSFGFGFDLVNNDYKLLRIMPIGKGTFAPSVDFYTLSTGKWEDISHLALGFSIIASCVYMNGALHWLAFVKGGKYGVLSFELSYNVFNWLMLPEDILTPVTDTSIVSKSIDVYRGFLAMFLFEHDGMMNSKLCTWVMKRYEDVESWTKLYNVDLGEPFKSFVGIGMDSNILLLDMNLSLVSLDFEESNCEKKVESNGCVRSVKWSFINVVTVTESLVLLDRGHEFCDGITCQRMKTEISASKR